MAIYRWYCLTDSVLSAGDTFEAETLGEAHLIARRALLEHHGTRLELWLGHKRLDVFDLADAFNGPHQQGNA